MNPVDVLCTAEEFKALRCPYTGKQLEVYMLVVPGQPPKFHAPEAYSPAQPYRTPETAYRMWNRENGIEGVKTGLPITCAYTGKVLAAASSREGHYFTGAFDPRMFWSREDFLRLASSRAGVSKYGAETPSRVEAVPPDMTPVKPREIDTDPTDEALKIAEGVLKKHEADLPPQASVTVSMAAAPAAKKGKKR